VSCVMHGVQSEGGGFWSDEFLRSGWGFRFLGSLKFLLSPKTWVKIFKVGMGV
jgi:hypothetical protein